MNNDKEDFWTKLEWPAAPNWNDYAVYEKYTQGKVLLLGSTKLLLPLCDQAWDIEPRYPDPKIIKRDWFTLDRYWDTIILDGGLAYGKEFTDKLLKIVLPKCNTFISRTFLNPNWKTTYAVYFPKKHELDPEPLEHTINEIYTFYIWKQKTKS